MRNHVPSLPTSRRLLLVRSPHITSNLSRSHLGFISDGGHYQSFESLGDQTWSAGGGGSESTSASTQPHSLHEALTFRRAFGPSLKKSHERNTKPELSPARCWKYGEHWAKMSLRVCLSNAGQTDVYMPQEKSADPGLGR